MKPIGMDLRQRIIAAILDGKVAMGYIADRFGVSLSTVKQLKKLHAETGSVEPRPRGGGNPPRVDQEGREWLGAFLAENQDSTIEETCRAYHEARGVTVSRAAMHRTMVDMGQSLKKKHSTRKRKSPKKE